MLLQLVQGGVHQTFLPMNGLQSCLPGVLLMLETIAVDRRYLSNLAHANVQGRPS